MAVPVIVQSATASTLATAGTASLVATFTSTPTSRNLLIACAGSDATITMSSSGWTLANSAVNSQGAYMWYKLAAVGESRTVTIAPGSATSPTVMALIEFNVKQGFDTTALDRTVSATVTSSGTSLATGTTAATLVANELAIAMENPHGFITPPASPTWTNSFTNILTVAGTTFATTSINVALFISTRTLTVVGTQTTTGGWTNSADNAGAILSTFKINPGLLIVNRGIRPHPFSPGLAR